MSDKRNDCTKALNRLEELGSELRPLEVRYTDLPLHYLASRMNIARELELLHGRRSDLYLITGNTSAADASDAFSSRYHEERKTLLSTMKLLLGAALVIALLLSFLIYRRLMAAGDTRKAL